MRGCRGSDNRAPLQHPRKFSLRPCWDTGLLRGPPLKRENSCVYQIYQNAKEGERNIRRWQFPNLHFYTPTSHSLLRKAVAALYLCVHPASVLFWQCTGLSGSDRTFCLFSKSLFQSLDFLVNLNSVGWQLKLKTLFSTYIPWTRLFHLYKFPKCKMFTNYLCKR